jgi:DNA-binding winged helix-turn-helix (wHTH) protein
MQMRFGDFALDSEARELRRGREPVHLSPKAFQLLVALVESGPKAVSKAALHERLWPETFVVEANLANLVGEIRAALDDDARRPRFIRTVHRFGYAFREGPEAATAPVRAATGPVCRLIWKGGRATLTEGEHVLGRDAELSLHFESPSVSRRHARLRISAGNVILEDLDSKNGTYVNARKVTSPVQLSDRDEIRVGTVRLTFRVVESAASTATANSREGLT